MRRKRVATIKLSEDELTAVVYALSEVIKRNDKQLAKASVWRDARSNFAALARRLDLMSLDKGWFSLLNASTKQVIYDDT